MADRGRALDRIRKCLRLAASSEPHEAAAALRQAQALMRAHGVSEADVALSEVRTADRATGAGETPPGWIVNLMHLVSEVTGAVPISSPVWRRGRWVGRVRFVGVGPRVEIAAYAFVVLLRQIRRARIALVKRLKRLKSASRIRRADVYCDGWIEGARRHVEAITPPSGERALVERWMAGQDLTQTSGRRRGAGRGDVDAWLAGLHAGDAARLHHGVGGAAQGVPRLGS